MTNTNDPYYDPTAPADTPVNEPSIEPARTVESTPADAPAATQPRKPVPATKPRSSLAGGTWVALIVGILLLVLLLVFIIQNQQQAEVNLFAWTWHFPAGVAYLISAIIGAVIMALVGGLRILELRRQVRHASRR